MVYTVYFSLFVLSFVLTAIYIFIWHKHFDINITMIFTLVPIPCLGYVFFSQARTLDSAANAVKLTYIGGCFLQFFIFLSIFDLCRIQIKNKLRAVLFVICSALYSMVLTIGQNKLFYKEMSFMNINGTNILYREYGPLHTVFGVAVIFFFIAGLIALVYSWFKNKQVPKRILLLLVIPDIVCVLCFFFGRRINDSFDTIPIGFVFAQFMYLLIAFRINLYDISDTVIDSMVREKEIGYLSFDFRYRYLGSNEMAKELIPGLSELVVDSVLGNRPFENDIRNYIDAFKKNNTPKNFLLTIEGEGSEHLNDRYYNVNVNFLYDDNRKRGYIVTLTDDTANRKYIKLLDNYNDQLRHEVSLKTDHIIEMHDNLILSLAMLVESRDNSTGGHVKRTSQAVRLLTDEIVKEGKIPLSPEFCKAIIKAAPMHDLGKIAVDDAILRKPSCLTDREFELMKSHTTEGARVIHEILKNTDDEFFKGIAENVAHYHHERWDGTGYPDSLSGESIPLEARIMAVADVYDALVNNRFYKGAFDFADANEIIMQGMGTHFDPALKNAYVNARPKLEEYYSKLKEM